jgi:molecular chaperone GrpE
MTENNIPEEEMTTLEDNEASASAAETDVQRLEAALDEARQEAAEAQDKAVRALADLQNFRKRKEREVAERIALANERLILELLPVLDDFERAFEAIPEEERDTHVAWIQGFDLIYRKLQKLLENQGVEAIAATGAFDPNVHEAITMVSSDEHESGDVVQVLRQGYKLKDKVVRASLVTVAQ